MRRAPRSRSLTPRTLFGREHRLSLGVDAQRRRDLPRVVDSSGVVAEAMSGGPGWENLQSGDKISLGDGGVTLTVCEES